MRRGGAGPVRASLGGKNVTGRFWLLVSGQLLKQSTTMAMGNWRLARGDYFSRGFSAFLSASLRVSSFFRHAAALSFCCVAS